eukprot:6212850-Pleurochrysis_carterae.AAC.3
MQRRAVAEAAYESCQPYVLEDQKLLLLSFQRAASSNGERDIKTCHLSVAGISTAFKLQICAVDQSAKAHLI